MKLLIFILCIVAFLQSATALPNLVLLVLIARSFLIQSRENYYFGFSFGLLLSLLFNQPLGLMSIFFLAVTFGIYLVKGLMVQSVWPLVIPFTLIVTVFDKMITQLSFGGLSWVGIIIQTLAIIPIYIIVQIWEEQFVPPKAIRLKVK